MRKVLLILKGIKVFTSQEIMDPAFMFSHLDHANCFAMEGLNMAFTAELTCEGKCLLKLLFVDVMVEKSQRSIDHIKQFQLCVLLVANINENMATVKIFDNYATTNSQKLHVTIFELMGHRRSAL